MSLSAGKIWNKLSHMTFDELHTRMRQELGKRAEYMLYRSGALRDPTISSSLSRNPGKFFFSADDLAGRIALLKEHLPLAISDTIEEADGILQHRFCLLGYRDLDLGPEIDWHLDSVHGKRSPLKPWYKIRFLDFNEVGDHKIPWELNRHQHLVTLAKAFAFSGNSLYAQEIERQFYSWQAVNPYSLGINWGSSLEVAFRSLSWIWVRNFLCLSVDNSNAFDRDLIRGLARNGQYIERYLSTYFSPNTHLLGEALALFFIGTLCPEIPRSSKWKRKGFDILAAEAQRQVRPDGVYFEQSLYYHVYALDMFLHARALAERNNLRFPDSFDSTLRRMLTVLETLSRNGPPPSFGDDDGGRLFNPRRNRVDHMTDPLILGACLFNDATICPSATLTEEAIWIFGQAAVAISSDSRNQQLVSHEFPDGGLYVIASERPQRMQMVIDAGPHGTGHGGHGHADALSIQISLDGQPWLIDPGSYVYITDGDERNQFRGTAAHSTVSVDKLDQAVPRGPFAWSSLPDVTVEQWEKAEHFAFFSGHHTGYKRLPDPVVHRRMIFHLHGEYWLVRDILEGGGEHDLETFLHFAPDVQAIACDGVITASRGEQKLAVFSTGTQAWNARIEEGFFSPAYGNKEPAPVGVFHGRLQLPAEHAMLIAPSHASQYQGNFQQSNFDKDAAHASAYEYHAGETTDRLIFGDSGGKWNVAEFASDATFLFVRRKRREITYLAFCGATFVEFEGNRVFGSPNPVGRLEWMPARTFISDEQSLKFFHGEAFRTSAPVT